MAGSHSFKVTQLLHFQDTYYPLLPSHTLYDLCAHLIGIFGSTPWRFEHNSLGKYTQSMNAILEQVIPQIDDEQLCAEMILDHFDHLGQTSMQEGDVCCVYLWEACIDSLGLDMERKEEENDIEEDFQLFSERYYEHILLHKGHSVRRTHAPPYENLLWNVVIASSFTFKGGMRTTSPTGPTAPLNVQDNQYLVAGKDTIQKL